MVLLKLLLLLSAAGNGVFSFPTGVIEWQIGPDGLIREDALLQLAEMKKINPKLTLLDIGCALFPWTVDYITACVDIMPMHSRLDPSMPILDNNVTFFEGDLGDTETWDDILEYVGVHGKFDVVVTTHTLEDLTFPQMVLRMMPKVAHMGYLSIPSKFYELTCGQWIGSTCVSYGAPHHRWTYTVRDEVLVGIFKVNPIQYK